MSSERHLGGLSADTYGDAYRADFLTLYQDFVASADKISDRREKANAYFQGINAALLGVGASDLFVSGNLVWITSIAGILICYHWWSAIGSYKSLNSAKFEVIQEMERHLPAAPYTEEWATLSRQQQPHTPFSLVEARVPLAFMALHVALAWFLS